MGVLLLSHTLRTGLMERPHWSSPVVVQAVPGCIVPCRAPDLESPGLFLPTTEPTRGFRPSGICHRIRAAYRTLEMAIELFI